MAVKVRERKDEDLDPGSKDEDGGKYFRDRIGVSQISGIGEMQKSGMAPLAGAWGTEWVMEPPANTKTTGRGSGLGSLTLWCPRNAQVEMWALGEGSGLGYGFGSHGHGGDGSPSEDVEVKSVKRSKQRSRKGLWGNEGGWRKEPMEKSEKR